MNSWDDTRIKKICCLGAGYVGGPTMAVIADKCPHLEVTVLDINEERIIQWNNSDLDRLPVYEPGLKDVIQRVRGRNLSFSTEIESVIAESQMVFISVNTPTKTKGFGAGYASDLKWVESSARKVAEFASGHTIVVEKSTIPVRTAQTIKSILQAYEEKGGRIKQVALLNNRSYMLGSSLSPKHLSENQFWPFLFHLKAIKKSL